ncbi:ROK family transcriptional regulator [Pacificibacter marinus]|uniref:ROK family transcriptional regulator n=1 Tax=Pacificibacter marinus TaxID=658057 RepID=UPI001C0689A1|nr:ROK family transcriptional regulator [Pacificibacter marinus]MBU2866001.1 ROK family transcriptional regulator [Pacificibacter marinus]
MKKDVSTIEALSDNQRDLLSLIRQNQPVRRSKLTDRTNLTQQSVHRIVTSLEDMGLIASAIGEVSGRGKPSPLISLVDRARFGLGILVNTDSVVISVVGLNCEPLASRHCDIDVSRRGPALDAIKTQVDILLDENNIDPNDLVGIGFTLPGFFVESHAQLNAPEILSDWSLVDFRPEIQALFNLPVILENSANARANGEILGPIGKTYRDFVYLGFDYGFGGSIVIDGRLHAGRAGNAGELSAIWTGEEIQQRPALGMLLKHLKKHGIDLSGIEQLRREFDPAWPGLSEWIDQTMPHLNRLIFGLTGIIDPEAIVFGGQIAPELAQILMDSVAFPTEFRYGRPPPLPDLVLGSTIDTPAANGAAQLPLKQLYFR